MLQSGCQTCKSTKWNIIDHRMHCIACAAFYRPLLDNCGTALLKGKLIYRNSKKVNWQVYQVNDLIFSIQPRFCVGLRFRNTQMNRRENQEGEVNQSAGPSVPIFFLSLFSSFFFFFFFVDATSLLKTAAQNGLRENKLNHYWHKFNSINIINIE